MQIGRILVIGVLLLALVGCSGTSSSVSDSDVKSWASEKDKNGNPSNNAPEASPYDQR